jgi:hypothetical protein
MMYHPWLVYLIKSHNPHSSQHALQNLRQIQTRQQHSHQVTLNFDTEFAYYRRDLITMSIVTKIPNFARLRGLCGLGAFFHAWELAIILCYKSRCLHCPIVPTLRRAFDIGQRTKEGGNFSKYRLPTIISISLRGLGPSLKGKQLRNTTTVFTSTCTLQAFSLPRCSP